MKILIINHSDLGIPEGTYPEYRLVDGAVGSSEELSEVFGFDIAPGPESNLDFQASIPLIWPQKTVLFQTDDEYYEEVGTPGFFNSKCSKHPLLCPSTTDS